MKKFLVILLTFLLVVLNITFVLAQEDVQEKTGFRPDAPPYAVRGPYWVGSMDFVIENGDRDLNGTVWYPALNPDNVEEVIEYDTGLGEMLPPELNLMPGRALFEAEPDRGNAPYPLVIYSHADTASRIWTAYYQEHLASYGFVVMAVDHTGASAFDFMILPDEEYYAVNFVEAIMLRPQDIGRVLDFAEGFDSSGSPLDGMIDMERVGVAGWSYGANTAFAVVGARLDFDFLATWCDGQESVKCNLLAGGERLAELAGLDSVPERLWPSMRDPRIDAIVTMAVGPAWVSPEGYSTVDVPMLAIGGTGDTINNFEEGTLLAYEHVASDRKALVAFENADHFIFGGGSPVWKTVLFDVLSDDVWDMDRAHDLTDHFSTAFLLAELYGDEEARAALAPDAVQFIGIDYQAVGY